MLRRVGRDGAVEGLVAEIAPRADGVGVDVDLEGELGHDGLVSLFDGVVGGVVDPTGEPPGSSQGRWWLIRQRNNRQ